MSNNNSILKERAERIEEAFRLLQGSKDNLGNIPGIIRQLVTLHVWEGYEWKGQMVAFMTFREFVETPPPQGLGTTVDELITFCKKYPEIADLVDQTVYKQAPEYHPPKGGYNIPPKKAKGTSFQRSLRRLRNLAENDTTAKKLRDKVFKGEISANYALRELGKRKARYGVEASPESVIAFAKNHLSKAQIKKIIEGLS